MNVLVTGATGFVGRALTYRLVADGIRVRATVRVHPTPADVAVEWAAVGDLGGPVDWARLMAGVDAVVHLAGLAHQVGRAARLRAAEFMFENAEISRRVARAARDGGARRFVLLGSVAAVGSHGKLPLDDSTSPKPMTDYGASKLAAEQVVGEELAGSATSLVVLRAPLMFGPGNPGNMARLLRLIARQAVLPFGAIDNARSFLFVENLVDAIVLALRADNALTGTYFIDDGTKFSTAELCRALASAARMEARIVRVPVWLLAALGRVGDCAEIVLRRDLAVNSYSVSRLTGSLVIDGRRFRAATGWNPPVATSEAILRTVDSVMSGRSER